MKSPLISSALFFLSAQALAFEKQTLGSQDEVPPDGTVWLSRASFTGSGCPQNSVKSKLSPDGTLLSLTFGELAATLDDPSDPKNTLTASKKFCRVQFESKYPSGYHYALSSVDYQGYANLDEGVSGVVSTSYSFDGVTTTARTETELIGPRTGNYFMHTDIDNSTRIYGPCGGETMISIQNAISLERYSGSGSGRLNTTPQIRLSWRRCAR